MNSRYVAWCRPSAFLPIPVDLDFLRGPNTIHLALQNPHDWPIRLQLQVFDGPGIDYAREYREMPPHTTQWVDVLKELYGPVLAAHPRAKLSLHIESDPVRMEFAPTLYFFMHNRNTDIWTANHL